MPSKKQNSFKLKNLKPEMPFRVPDGYFDAFPDRLQEKISPVNRIMTEKSGFRSFGFFKLAIAASFIGLMLITYTGIKFLLSKQDKLPGIQQSELADYSDYPAYEPDETMLYDLYSEIRLEDNSNTTQPDNATDEMIEYLLLEGADIEVLMQEL